MLDVCRKKYFPSSGRKALLKLAKAILACVYCSSKDGDLAASAVLNIPLGEKRREVQETKKFKRRFFSLLEIHPWILLTQSGSLTTGRSTGYFLHAQNYLQSSDMILGELPSCLRASTSMRDIQPLDYYFPQPACISLAVPKSRCRAQASPQQCQQRKSSPVLEFAGLFLIMYVHIRHFALLPFIVVILPSCHWTHSYWIRRAKTCLLPYIYTHNAKFSYTYLTCRLYLSPAGQTSTKTAGQSGQKMSPRAGGSLSHMKTCSGSVKILAKRSLPPGTYLGPENIGGISRCWSTSLRSEAYECKLDQPQGWDLEGREG